MSNGYLLAAEADFAAASEIAEGFGLEVISAASIAGRDAAALAEAANIGIVLSAAAAQDNSFVALMHNLARTLRSAQLVLATPDARNAFAFLPEAWPSMSLDEARSRSAELTRRRQEASGAADPPRAHPLPPVEDTPGASESVPDEPPGARDDELGGGQAETKPDLDGAFGGTAPEGESFGAEQETPPVEEAPTPDDLPAAPPSPAAPTEETPAPPASVAPAPAPQTAEPPPRPSRTRTAPAASAPADATAFAPTKLRRGSPELVRIVIHQPQDLQAVIKAAKKLDPRTSPAPSGMKVGDVPIGASVGVSLEVRGAACDGAIQRRTWQGDALDFNFSAEPDADVKQAVFLARVFVDDAQIGVLAFTRPVGGAHKNAHSTGDRVRLKRHKRVFISYSSKDRETVAAIATAYQAAGVQHFFDRTSLKSGEEWSPRLRQEIDRADLFHLCWSKAASASEWVEKEAEHALTRRHRSNGKKPDITVQMLDGPPWAPHPPHLDSINFDDFVRAAIVGYARGDGEA